MDKTIAPFPALRTQQILFKPVSADMPQYSQGWLQILADLLYYTGASWSYVSYVRANSLCLKSDQEIDIYGNIAILLSISDSFAFYSNFLPCIILL